MSTSVTHTSSGGFFTTADTIAYQTFLLLLAGLTLFGIVLVKSKTGVEFWNNPYLFAYTIFVTSFQLSRVIGAMFYKSSYKKITSHVNVLEHPDYTPPVTFVIPCKNEEASIEKTIRKCFAADYPKDMLDVIIINDGSTDGTQAVLERMKYEFPSLTVVNWEVNQGKRQAMACGFKLAKGEIIIQLDSDSYIEPSTVKNFVKPFQHPDIGAVCGHADPENADKNWLTKMQAAYYFMSFRILKAAESTFLTVFCCSGCSSAYKKSVVLPIIDQWREERFLGEPITWGDDRALTNWVLRRGYKTVYTDTVQAYTIVPQSLKKFLTQQVRWKKGWFVNSLFATRFVFRKQPYVALTYFFPLFILTILTPIMATKALIYNPLFGDVQPTYYMIGVLLVAIIITLYYRSVARNNKYWPFVFVWSMINMLFLSFILYYALLRLRDRNWGTR